GAGSSGSDLLALALHGVVAIRAARRAAGARTGRLAGGIALAGLALGLRAVGRAVRSGFGRRGLVGRRRDLLEGLGERLGARVDRVLVGALQRLAERGDEVLDGRLVLGRDLVAE